MNKNIIVGIGNIYVETNYLGLETAGNDFLYSGKEYRAQKWETRLGGSVVNFVMQLNKLGGITALIGKCGKDKAGDELVQLLKQHSINTDLITLSSDVQTSVDTGVIFKHNGQNVQLVAGNANQSLSFSDIDLSNPIFNQVSAVYLGGFLKQESLYKDYPKLLKELSTKGLRLFLDHGRIPVDLSQDTLNYLFQSLQFIECYFPNEEEILGMTSTKTINDAVDKAITMGPKLIVVKLGERGCRVKTKTLDFSTDGFVVPVVSTVGAGDTFNASFVFKYLENNNLEYCARFANAAAALRVSQNELASNEEIEYYLSKH